MHTLQLASSASAPAQDLRAKSATPLGELRRVGIPIELTPFRGLKHVRIPIQPPNGFPRVGLYPIDPLPPFGAA